MAKITTLPHWPVAGDLPRAADLVPLWLEHELQYAVDKHGGRNPQLSAFEGGLQPGGQAWNDITSYFKRFSLIYAGAAGDRHGLLSASQLLGKYVGTGRALVSAIYQHQDGYDRGTADALTIMELEEHCLGINGLKHHFTSRGALFDLENYGDQYILPAIEQIEATRVRDPGQLLLVAADFLFAQAQLFVDFTYAAGVLAAPGQPSGQVSEWTL